MVTDDDARRESNDRTDWPRIRAMNDADIQHDTDSPRTTAADWEGAVLKEAGGVVGHTRTREPTHIAGGDPPESPLP